MKKTMQTNHLWEIAQFQYFILIFAHSKLKAKQLQLFPCYENEQLKSFQHLLIRIPSQPIVTSSTIGQLQKLHITDNPGQVVMDISPEDKPGREQDAGSKNSSHSKNSSLSRTRTDDASSSKRSSTSDINSSEVSSPGPSTGDDTSRKKDVVHRTGS